MIDAFRARFPDFGVALYAYGPGGDVTFEVIAPDGATFCFAAATADAAVALALPPEPETTDGGKGDGSNDTLDDALDTVEAAAPTLPDVFD